MAIYRNPFQQYAQTESPLAGLARGLQAGMGLARQRQQMELEKERLAREKELDPFKKQLAETQLETAQFGLEQKKEQAQRINETKDKLESLDKFYSEGAMPDDQYLKLQAQITGDLAGYLKQKQAQEANQEILKAQAEKEAFDRNLKLMEFQRKSQKDKNDLIQKQIDRELEINKPIREYQFNQQVFAQELSPQLNEKKKPNVGLNAKRVEEVTKVTSLTAPLLNQLRTLQGLIDQYGVEKAPTEAKRRMEGMLTQIQLDLKSEPFANLGVLTGPDLDILTNLTGDPTAFTNFSSKNAKTKLKEVEKYLMNKTNTKLGQTGFKPFTVQEMLKLVPPIIEGDAKTPSVNQLNTPQNQSIWGQVGGQ